MAGAWGTAAPELEEPRRVAGLGGHKLLMVRGALPRRLKSEKVSLAKLQTGEARHDPLSEDQALATGLPFKLLAPIRNGATIENCARHRGHTSRGGRRLAGDGDVARSAPQTQPQAPGWVQMTYPQPTALLGGLNGEDFQLIQHMKNDHTG